jgi:MFS transporter, PPP family, 3-phenylpropionic acid transporter
MMSIVFLKREEMGLETYRLKKVSEAKVVYRSLSIFYFLFFFGIGALYTLLPLYYQKFGLSGTQIGTIMAVGPVISILFQPVWGMICDRFQAEQKVLACTLTCAASIALLFPLMHGFIAFLLLFAGLQLFQSAINPITDSITLSFVQKQGGDYGNIRLFGAIGFAVAVWFAGTLAERFGLVVIFYVYAGAFLFGLWWVRQFPQAHREKTGSVWSGLGRLIRLPKYVIFLGAAFLIFGPMNAHNYYFSLLYTKIGGTVAGVGVAFLLFAGSEAPVMKLTGPLVRKYGILTILMISGVVSALRWGWYASAPSAAWVIMLFFIQGMSVGLFLPTAATFIREHAPREVQVTAQALYSSFGNGLGTMFTSFIGGVLYDRSGIFSTYLYFSFSTVVGILLVIAIAILNARTSRQG